MGEVIIENKNKAENYIELNTIKATTKNNYKKIINEIKEYEDKKNDLLKTYWPSNSAPDDTSTEPNPLPDDAPDKTSTEPNPLPDGVPDNTSTSASTKPQSLPLLLL